VLVEDGEGLLAGLAPFWVDEDGVSAGELLSSGVVQDGDASLALYTPDDSELEDDGSGALIGSYVVFVRRDDSGDGVLDEDEPILGVAETRLLYISGKLSKKSEAMGLVLGWNAVWFDINGSEVPIVYGLDEIPLELNLTINESLVFGGTSEVPDTPADPIRLTAFPLDVEINDDVWMNLVFDEQLSSTWEVELSGRPNDSHMVIEEGKLPSALEIPMAYLDVDESEDLNNGDETLYGVCAEVEVDSGVIQRPLLLMWIDELTNLSDAITTPLMGLVVGWSGWAIDSAGNEPPVQLDASQIVQLSAESSCVLE
jgi:hypothetical protein